MKKTVSLLLLPFALCSASALAAQIPMDMPWAEFDSAKISPFDDEGFYPLASLPAAHTPKNLESAALASVRLSMMGGSCSASLISADGYVLTAAHCVTDCLIDAGMATSTKKDGYGYTEVTNQMPTDLTCKNLFIEELNSDTAKIVYMGRGYSEFDDSKVMDIPEAEFQKVLNSQDDFAVLKYEIKATVACVSTGTKNPAPLEPIWAVGFPGRNSRTNGFGSDGNSEYVSYGFVTSDIGMNQYYKEQGFSAEIIARNQQFYGGGGQIVSNMDIYPGNSGSMAINSDGQLVGVNTAVAVPNASVIRNNFKDYTGVTLGIEMIRQEMEAALGATRVSEIFNCQ